MKELTLKFSDPAARAVLTAYAVLCNDEEMSTKILSTITAHAGKFYTNGYEVDDDLFNQADLAITFMQDDMRSFCKPEAFDATIAALLTDAGFSAVDAYGGLDGTPYDHHARRLVVVARKCDQGAWRPRCLAPCSAGTPVTPRSYEAVCNR